MDYKVMKRPMFKMGGPTSGGTGITSGLETPRQNFSYGTSAEAIAAIPGMFEKTMAGLEDRRSALGPMALLRAAQSGAFSGVQGFGDLAMAAGSPEFLGAGFQGLEAGQKLDTQIDALGLKEATTMATLLKKKDSAFSTRIQSQAAVREIQKQVNGLKSQLAQSITSFFLTALPFLLDVVNNHDSIAPPAFLLPKSAPKKVSGVTDLRLLK